MNHDDETSSAASIADEVFRAALAAADPYDATRDALARSLAPTPGLPPRWHWIVATGKAAPAMARAAVDYLAEHQLQFAGGVLIAAEACPPPHPQLTVEVGDHPTPGRRSLAAAARITALADEVAENDVVIALVSGGTSALTAAPVDEVRAEDITYFNELLLGAGLPIRATNAVRKRFARCSAGRIALAFAPATIHPIILSDVIGDDPVDVASGPWSGDPLTAHDVEQILRETELARRLPLSMAAYLGAVISGDRAETPKPGSVALAHVREPIVIGNTAALAAAADCARRFGRHTLVAREPISGEAEVAGRSFARAAWFAERGTCLIAGGETTVEIPLDHGIGGRCQQFALAAAMELCELHTAAMRDPRLSSSEIPRVTILAAGTDGRDGPTDVAGAIVDDLTWERMSISTARLREHLRRCDAFPALEAGGALLETGLTGTNVADIVVALRD
jgi:glycerate 2-kinase